MVFSALNCQRGLWSHVTACTISKCNTTRSSEHSIVLQSRRYGVSGIKYEGRSRYFSTHNNVVSRSLPEQDKQGGSEDEDISALDEEEFREIFDTTNQIPGNYRDAMNNKTELGAAIRDACSELDALGSLEQNLLQEAEGLLKQVGYKGSLFEQPNKDEGSSSSSSSSSS